MLQWKEEFTAWITIDGKEAVEYDVQTSEDNKTVTCWIASELGKKFTICWKKLPTTPRSAGSHQIDGNDCGGTRACEQERRRRASSSSTLSLQDLGLMNCYIPFTKSLRRPTRQWNAPSPPQLKRKASAELPREQTPDDSEELAALEEVKTLRVRGETPNIGSEASDQAREEPRIKDEDGDVIDLTQNTSRSKKGKGDAKRPFISGR
ncbi:hypothetical protein K438DRAFT_1822920 [Mycena galopus ATCC 62051]|nr:hypothetical protein K438DRAFT_1822920 [Mycena galopus ATCC 62051]